MKKNKVLYISLAGVMAAIIAVFTSFVKIPTGINEGYLHFGDSMIYLAGSVLGPIGILSASVGGALADILAGAPEWALATAIIKAINCVPFVVAAHLYQKKKGTFKIINIYTAPMTVVSGLITIFGYLVAEGIMYSFPSAWTSVPFSIVQAVGSAVLYLAVGAALDAVKIKRFIKK